MKLMSLLVVGSIALFSRDAPGSDEPLNGEGYAYFGRMSSKQDSGYAMLMGVGGNGYVYRGLYAGAEIGYLAYRDAFNRGIGRSFVNVGYSVVNRESPGWVVPFAEFGMGGYFRNGGVWVMKAGGGATIWVHRNLGIRGAAFWEQPVYSGLYFYHNYYGGTSVAIGVAFKLTD